MSEIEWKVFKVNSETYWVARSKEEAMADRGESCNHEIAEVPDEDMCTLRFTDTNENDRPVGKGRSFRSELNRRVAAGLKAPEMFASTEW